MAFFGGDNEFYQLTEQVRMCQTQLRPDIKLEICHIICQMLLTQPLDDDLQKEVTGMEKYIRTFLTNSNFRRDVNKRQALIEREPITYFGDELLKGDQYDFDEKLEKELTTIEFRITTFLGNVMSFIQEQQAM
jgi:hypothetical protein